MSRWNHRMCGECWIQREAKEVDERFEDAVALAVRGSKGHYAPGVPPAEIEEDVRRMMTEAGARQSIRRPVVVPSDARGTCCFCQGATRLGIFVRGDPVATRCTHD